MKEIKLAGFKSFPRKTTFKLKDGITSFVGPNGCGKSNVIDAIKWGLGETSTKRLRAERMEDLIFTGTEKRSPVGMAEVSLTFHNNGGIPIDYDEVEVKRRYFRSGESEFYINNTSCRLRDIHNLFANTGLLTAILDQGVIDDFLISDSEMRREILESIAGIKRYRVDRKEAMNKLNRVSRGLEKIDIILSEKKKSARSLKREANRAKRYRKFKEELKNKSIELGESRVWDIQRELKKKEEKLEKLEEKLDSAESRITNLNNEIKITEDKLRDLRKEYREREEKIQKLQEKISNLREEKAGNRGELKHINNLIEELPENIEKAISELEEEREEIQEKEAEYNSRIPEIREKLKKEEERVSELSREIEKIKERDLSLRVQMQERRARLKSLNENIEKYKSLIKEKQEKLEEEEGKIAEIDEKLHRNAEEINQLTEKIEEGENLKASLLRNLREINSDLNRINKEIQFYQNRDIELSEGTKKIRENLKLPLLSDSLEVERGYEAPIESIVGDFLAGMVGDRDDIEKAIDLLKEDAPSGGILIQKKKDTGESSSELAERVSGKFADLIKDELSKYELVEDIEEAIEKSFEKNGNYVTKQGDIIKENLILLSSGREGILMRRARCEELREEREKKKKEYNNLEEEKSTLLEELEQYGRQLEEHEEKREALVDEKSTIESEFSRIKFRIESISDNKKETEEEIASIKREIKEEENEKEETEKKIKELSSELSDAENQRDSIQDELDKINEEREVIRRREGEIRGEIKRLKEGLNLIGKKEKLQNNIEKLEKALADESEELEEKKEINENINKKINENEEKLEKIKNELSENQENREAFQKQISEVKDIISESRYRERSLKEDIYREFEVGIEGREIEINHEEVENRIAELRKKIESLKPINPLAIEQHEEKKEEIDKIETEREDLISSREDIEKTISEIDRKARKEFKQTIEDIKKDFRDIYDKLSPGGTAEIRLSDDNILEADIEVLVEPKGKNLKRMELFSTGEKTLAASALLLAIMKKRESPVYIMDEIDAPLDENNIERFNDILHEFSEDAQILIVTHNRRTMERADSIYGVTMQEEGVSSVFSIDSDEI